MGIVAKYLLKGLMAIFAALPLKLHYFNATWLAHLVGKTIRYRRDVVITNLSRCFPERTYDEIEQIADDFYRHFADLFCEMIWFGGCHNPKRLRKANLVTLAHPEEFKALCEASPSIMTLSSHAGNWELIGGLCDSNYCPDVEIPVNEKNLCVSYLAGSNKAFDDIIRDNRFAPLKDPKHIPGYMESRNLVRFIFSHKDEKKYYMMITDQHPYIKGSDNVKVTFFGRECSTMSAGAALARKFKFPVCYLRMNIESRGHYTMEFVPICSDASQMSIQEIMDRYYQLLEEDIRRQPANYLWTHKRWKEI